MKKRKKQEPLLEELITMVEEDAKSFIKGAKDFIENNPKK